MELLRSSRFKRHFKKLPPTVRVQALMRMALVVQNPFHPLLHNHPLHGTRRSERSINVNGNYRIAYRTVAAETILLIDIGTHHELYGS